jgi:hypothetical protein
MVQHQDLTSPNTQQARSYKMANTYKEITTEIGYSYIEMTTETGEVFSIPKDEANSDYQRYLNPEAEQSTPNLTV